MNYVVTVNDKELFDSVKAKLVASGFEILEETPRFLTIFIYDPIHFDSVLVIEELMSIPGVRNARKEIKYEAE